MYEKGDSVRRGIRVLQLFKYARSTNQRELKALAQVAQLKFGVCFKTAFDYAEEVLMRLEKENEVYHHE